MTSKRTSLPILDEPLSTSKASCESTTSTSRTQRRSHIYFRIVGRIPRFAWAVGSQRLRRDSGPHSLTHTTTFKCNYHCKEICDSPLVHQAMQLKPNGHDLTTSEIADIYRQLPAMDYVRFTGGEPTLRKDFIEISHLAEEWLRPIVLHLTTNASMPERVIQFSEERPRQLPLDLMISIDGVDDKHCESRHNPYAFERCMETLTSLAPRQRELKLNIRVNQTVADAEGMQHYRKLHQRLKSFGIRHQVVLAYSASATYAIERDRSYAPTRDELFTPVEKFERGELQQFFDEVNSDIQSELSGPERWIQQYYLDGIRARMLHNEPRPNPTCVALSSHLRIFPNGDIPTCQFNSHIVGNLRLQRFKDVWNGDLRKAQYAWVKSCAGCWAGCEVQPSAAYSGDILLHQWRR